jgi:hypothetical protein
MPLAEEQLTEITGLAMGTLRMDENQGSCARRVESEVIGIEAFVANRPPSGQTRHEQRAGNHIAQPSRCAHEAHRSSARIPNHGQFRVEVAFGASDRPASLPSRSIRRIALDLDLSTVDAENLHKATCAVLVEHPRSKNGCQSSSKARKDRQSSPIAIW